MKLQPFKRLSEKRQSKKQSSSKKSVKQQLSERTAHWNFKRIITFMVTAAVVVAVVSGWYWYQNIFMTSERRLYAAIENSMSTRSVVRTLTEGGSGNQVVQQFRFHFAPQRVIQNDVAYTERSATSNTRVVTEGIIFPTSQYLRYTEYSTANQNSPNTNIDELLGEWAEEKAITEDEAKLTYLSEQVSLVLFGNFSTTQRKEFINTMKDQKIYSVDYNAVQEQDIDGASSLVYPVSVKLKPYATLLNESFKRAGYGEFPPLNPDNYREDATVNAQIIVRKKDNVIVGVNFGGREERYSGYGIIQQVEAPQAVRNIDELQQEVERLFNEQLAQ